MPSLSQPAHTTKRGQPGLQRGAFLGRPNGRKAADRPVPGAPLIRPAAAAAVICQYAPPLPGGKAGQTPLRRMVLGGAGAAGLVAALNEIGPLTSRAKRCDREAGLLPFDQFIWFTYRHGKPGHAMVTFTDCQLAVVALPAGARDAGPSPHSLSVFLAVRRAPACQPGQLRLDYRGGGAGAGNDFGGIVFRDEDPAPCQLAGTLTITGVSMAGRPVTSTLTAQAAPPEVLSPDTARLRDGAGAPADSMVYYWALVAEYRDDAASPNGLCTTHQVIPAAWRVRLPGGFLVTVPNADIRSPSRLDSSGGLVTCRGRLGIAGGPAFVG